MDFPSSFGLIMRIYSNDSINDRYPILAISYQVLHKPMVDSEPYQYGIKHVQKIEQFIRAK